MPGRLVSIVRVSTIPRAVHVDKMPTARQPHYRHSGRPDECDDQQMDSVTLGTWALVAATVGLVIATAVLARYARLQVKEMRASAKQSAAAAREAGRQTAALEQQGDLQRESLAVSAEMMRAARAERAAAAPLVVTVELREHVAGHAVLHVRNAARDAVMRIARIRILSVPDEGVYLDREFADGTLGVAEEWTEALDWNTSRIGDGLAVLVNGHRIEGPIMTREFRFRIGQDGKLIDLGSSLDPLVDFL